MDALKNQLNILAITYDEIANNYNEETINTKVMHIKDSIKELSNILDLLNKFNK